MKYFEVEFHIAPNSEVAGDVLSSLLADCGFEAFEPADCGLRAWVQQSQYLQESVDDVIACFPLPDTSITYTVAEAPDENWNAQWEQEGFEPITVGLTSSSKEDDECLVCIHDTRHTDVPVAKYDIKINPCQAFGTGSHQTTRMILRQLLEMDLRGGRVIDAGTGTGILAIMSAMLGAESLFAYDIDEWSVRNARENCRLNDVENATIELGCSDALVQTGQADLLIANINRNILLGDIPTFARHVKDGGHMILSGFYREDVPVLVSKAQEHGFVKADERHDQEWTLLLFVKP